MFRKSSFSFAALACTSALVAGCGSNYTVTRMVDGRVEEGRFIEPNAYAAYLRGAVAEAHGDFGVALTEYQNASKLDPADPESWTRIAAVRCKVNPQDLQARVAVREALIRDEDYAPAWQVRASCEIARDVDRVDVERSAARAAELDPKSVSAQTLLASVEEKRDAEAARRRLVALTLVAGDDANTWSALGNWAASHADAELEKTAFSRVAIIAPTKSKSVVEACEALAGDGALREARSLAGVLADAQHRADRDGARATFSISHSPLAARLAVDDAIASKNLELARARASTGRVPLDEVASRAALLGETDFARKLASEILASDPQNFSANMALAAVDSSYSIEGLTPKADERPPAATVVAAAASPSKLTMPTVIESIFPGDSLVTDAAARLAASGKLDGQLISGDAEVDLDVRTGKIPPPSKGGMDARHRLLACAFQTAAPPRECDAVTRRLDRTGSRDLLVNVALAHLAVRRGAQPAELKAIADRLKILGPNDPLVTTTLRDLSAS